MADLRLDEMMRTEVVADVYGGDNCDEVIKYFKTYCAGDRDSEQHDDDLIIKLSTLPVGAVITVSYPMCPHCGVARMDRYADNTDWQGWAIIGHDATCECGFDWEGWILDNYS